MNQTDSEFNDPIVEVKEENKLSCQQGWKRVERAQAAARDRKHGDAQE
jgi:hypothetical protein